MKDFILSIAVMIMIGVILMAGNPKLVRDVLFGFSEELNDTPGEIRDLANPEEIPEETPEETHE